MARKYHQSKKDREDERRGMEKARHRERSRHDDYGREDPRRRHELEDAGLIHEDHMEVANLPQAVHYKPWPKPRGYGSPEHLDDTIKGIDRQMDDDDDEMKRHEYPEKY